MRQPHRQSQSNHWHAGATDPSCGDRLGATTIRRVAVQEYVADLAALEHSLVARARVVTEGGVIRSVDTETASDQAIHLQGTLLPGLIDLQVNGAGGHSVDELDVGALNTVAETVLVGGGAAFLPTLITAPFDELVERVAAVASWIRGYEGNGAAPVGIHLEGPFLTSSGAHDEGCFVDPTPARIGRLLDAADGALRLITMACDRPGTAEAIGTLRQNGVHVAIGHVRSGEGLDAAIAAGASMVTHLFNAMPPLHHREPGPIGVALDDRRLRAALICDGAHVHPSMVRNAFGLLGPDRTILVSDSVGAAGMPDGTYSLAGMTVTSRDGVVRNAEGRLAGSALTMALAARHFLTYVPTASPWTLARVAAHNPAQAIGLTEIGRIAPGQRAWFSLLRDDGSIEVLRG